MNRFSFRVGMLVLLTSQLAVAQIYRAVDDNGNPLPVFTDRPQTVGGKVIEIMPAQTNSLPGTEMQDEIEDQQNSREVEAAANGGRLQLLQQQFEQAQVALEAAEAAKVRGLEYRDGDRVGKTGGGSRYSQQYFDRQTSLDADVRQAQERVDQLDAQISEVQNSR